MLGGQTQVHESDIDESYKFIKELQIGEFNYVLGKIC